MLSKMGTEAFYIKTNDPKTLFFCTRVESAPTQLGGGVMDLINQTINHRNSKISKVIFSMVRPSTPSPPPLDLNCSWHFKNFNTWTWSKMDNKYMKQARNSGKSFKEHHADRWLSEWVSEWTEGRWISFLCIEA